MDIKAIVKDAVVVSDGATFEDALRAMENSKTNTLLVVDSEGLLCGEVTVLDMLDAIVPESLDGDAVMRQLSTDVGLTDAVKGALEKPVADFMSVDYTTLTLEDNMVNVLASALANARARLPVVDTEGRPIGIISRQGLKHILGKLAEA